MHVFKERSPIHYVDHINGALAFFQGSEDKVILEVVAFYVMEIGRWF